MDPDELEYFSENKLISIVPIMNHTAIHFISCTVGPFRAGLPLNVPLWMALNLKQQQKCRIQPPDWMEVEFLENVKETEKTSRTFTKMPSEHYMAETKLLLSHASDDIPHPEQIRTIVKDIWDIRMSKLRTSVDLLIKEKGSYASLDHLTPLEINAIRPMLPHALDTLHRMINTKNQINNQTQNNTTLGSALSRFSASTTPRTPR